MGFPSVTVITVTKNRIELLKRAIQSVKNQDYKGKIYHLIYVDDCDNTYNEIKNLYGNDKSIIIYKYKRNSNDLNGPSLLARLRNNAVSLVDTEWFLFLDDDNLYLPNHISELVSFAIKNKVDAAFSNSKVYYRDETPYIKKEWLWCRDSNRAKTIWNERNKQGIIFEDSNEIHFKYGIVIDTNVWLIKKSVFIKSPISDKFTQQDWEDNLAEDDKLMFGFYENGVNVKGNGKATVKYYLGGYSNVFDGSVEGTIKWEKL